MEDTINYEKKVDAYRADMLPEELLILDSINAELKINKYSISGKTDNELLSIPDGFDLYGAEGKALFGNDIKTFSDKEVWEKFYKLKFDIEKRYLLPTILGDFEDPERKLSLDAVLNLDYEGIDKMLNSDDENQQRFCLNFIKDVATYTGLTTGMRMDLMKKINDTLIEKIDAHSGLAKEIELAMSYLFTNSDESKEIHNLSAEYYIAFFQGLPTHISKNIGTYNWLYYLIKNPNDLEEPNDVNNLLIKLGDKLDANKLGYVYLILENLGIHNAIPVESVILNLESIITSALPPNDAYPLFFVDPFFNYFKKNNQTDKLQQILSTFSEAKRATFIYAFLCSAQYHNNEQDFLFAEEIMQGSQNTTDIIKVLISGTQSRWEIHYALYKKFFNKDATGYLDANDVKTDVINRVSGKTDIYSYQVLKCAGAEIAKLNTREVLMNSKNILQDIRTLERKSLSINDLDRINEIIEKQPTEEMKQSVRYECILNNPIDLVGRLVNYDTNELFGFDKILFDTLFANSPDWQERTEKLRNDLISATELVKETGNTQIIKDLFEIYNLTSFSRYSKTLLKHMVENKDKPTGKPVFPIFMTKRDRNGAFNNQLKDEGEVGKMITEFDIRVFEPGDNNEKFFGSSGTLEKFYTNYLDRGGKRENVNSMIGMHGTKFFVGKAPPLDSGQYISMEDKALFVAMSKYVKGGTLSLVSCSTGSNIGFGGESNFAQSAARTLRCRVHAPNDDSNLESIVYNKSGGIEFTNYSGRTSTVIYDGRQDLESKEDALDIDKNIVENRDVLSNDGLGAVDFAIQTGSLGDVSVEKTETENKWKISKGTDVVFVEKKQNNGKFVLSIDATGSESVSLELPYTAFSKWLPKRIVDFEGNSSQEENNFRVESDSTIKLNIVKSGTGAQETSLNKDRVYNKGKNILIDIQEYTDVSGINIYDVGGKLVKNIMGVDHTPLEVDMNGAPSGMYIVTINKSGLLSSTKIILP